MSPVSTHGVIGAGERSRTPDLLITNELLYQLSYTSTAGNCSSGIDTGNQQVMIRRDTGRRVLAGFVNRDCRCQDACVVLWSTDELQACDSPRANGGVAERRKPLIARRNTDCRQSAQSGRNC